MIWTVAGYAQVVEGIVMDANDNEVLSFTHVYNLTTSKGVFTDVNGYYRIEVKQGDTLQFSFVGYVKQTITVSTSSLLNVKLKPDIFKISEVVIRPGENPAHRIINLAIANRNRHNPENLQNYTCMVYNKMITEARRDSASIQPDENNAELYMPAVKDTGFLYMINETVIKREYKYKGNVSEHILSSRFSGFKEYQQMSFFHPLLQFFHFYYDVLEWKFPVKFYLNPISPGSTSKYFFLLCDTIISGIDSTFVISFQPRRTANFEGLKGLLYINSNGWAIQSVVAEPADYSPIRLKIKQQYALTDSVWFPSELSLELIYGLNNNETTFIWRGKSLISDVDLTTDLAHRNIKARNLTLADDAYMNQALIDRYRQVELTMREDSVYRLFKEGQFDYLLRFSEGLSDHSAIPVKIINLPLEKFVQQNYHEGYRIGLGMYTNRRLSPWFSAGGYYGYGMRDRRSKYGASFSLYPEKDLDSELKLWWTNDLYDMMWSKETGVAARKLWGKFDMEAVIKVQDVQTTFDYTYKGRDMATGWLRNAEAGIRLRYAHNEERAKLFRRTMPATETRYPVIHLNVTVGIPDRCGSTFRYLKAEAGVERNWYIRNLGHAFFSIWGGWIDGYAPLPMAFTVTGSGQSLYLSANRDWRQSFNVLTGGIYSANRYLNFFLYHDFGTLLGKTQSKLFRPRIAVAQSFGWSKLDHPEQHFSADFDIFDMRRGYFESGIVVEEILRIELLKLCFIGIGGGIYGAYGGSVQRPFEQTLTPKIRLSINL